MLMWVPHYPKSTQIRKLTVCPEDWDGDIQSDADYYDEGNGGLLFPSWEYGTRPMI